MLLRHFRVELCLALLMALLTSGALGQQSPRRSRDSEQAPRIPESAAIVEIELLLAEWKTAPPEAGQQTPDELSGSSDQVLQRIAALEKAGKLTVLDRFRLTTLEGAKAMVQVGERVPVTQGVTIGQFGTTRNVIDRNIGTIVMVMPTASTPEAIQIDLNFEKSKLFTPPDAPPLAETTQGQKIPAVATSTLTIQTALRVPSGKTVAVAGHSSDGRHHILLVSAKAR